MPKINEHPHRRYNPLTGEWVLVSPHRTKRPWQGQVEKLGEPQLPSYDDSCYLCPGNERAGGKTTEDYRGVYVFENDFPALLEDTPDVTIEEELFRAETEKGICRVVCFSSDHSLTLAKMEVPQIIEVINEWANQYTILGNKDAINHVMIFENRGEVMGCSNPHPHGQIWAQETLPDIVLKKDKHQKAYFEKHGKSILMYYVEKELSKRERIIDENEYFVSLVPYWAVWPYEAMIIPKRHVSNITELIVPERKAFAELLNKLTIRYDNLFETSFPYSAGIHQAPTSNTNNKHWHMHMSFFPPLLRSATVKKFMVGYEMFAGPQRDITAEMSAKTLRELPLVHYSKGSV